MVQKAVSYWTTNFINDERNYRELGDLTASVLNKMKTVADTTYKRPDDSVIQIRHRKIADDGTIYLHCVSFTPDGQTGIVPRASQSDVQAPLSLTDAPENADFLTGSMVALISGDHVLFCAESATAKTLAFYLQKLSERVNSMAGDRQFELQNVINKSELKKLRSEGAQIIGLDATLNEYDLNSVIAETTTATTKQKILAALRDIIEKDQTLRDLRDRDMRNVSAKVSLRIDGRHNDGLSQADFDESASDIIDDLEPGFFIRTKSGSKITHSSMTLSKTLNIAVKNETIDHASAWVAMDEYLAELKSGGYIE
ncbi:MAG: hypothetical protein AAGI92_05555 [Pseudomonadota bacterium]